MWKRLTHPNVLPLLGVTIDRFQLISNWMSGGHLLGYITNNSDADRLGLVGVPPILVTRAYTRYQLSDIAKGLCYLHSCNIIHGDLKGVRGCSKSRSTPVMTPPSPTSLWTTPDMRGSRTLASPRSLKTWILHRALSLSMVTP
jgi:serine/threonine protein kinase